MQMKTFMIPVKTPDAVEQELNRLLATRRILNVHRRFVDNGENSFWTLAVEYVGGEQAAKGKRRSKSRARIDYKEVLNAEDFAVFSRLREVRKELAAKDAVPVYSVFSNAQLAEMVTERVDSKAAMRKISGIGEATVKKYGDPILAVLREKFADQGTEAS